MESGVNLTVNENALLPLNRARKLKVHKKMESNILLVKMFPGIDETTINYLFNYPELEGLILETFGSGNITNEVWFLNALKKVIDRGIPVINVTQCSGGTVSLGQYETSFQLQKMGVISGKDITTEAALAKLMYLLGQNISVNSFKTIFETSLRGEMQ